MHLHKALIAALGVVAFFAAVPAQADLIINGSFENAPGGSLSVSPGSPLITGWNVESGSVDSVDAFMAHTGSKCVDLDGFFMAGALSQTVGVTVGQTYQLSFWMAGNPDAGPTVKSMNVSWGPSSLGTFTFNITGKTEANMGWAQYQMPVLATSPLMKLQFTSLDAADSSYGPCLDDVSLIAIPEPQVWSLIAASFGVAFYFRRRYRN
jgi:choice-of-anchor C domain-containing protein